MTLYPWCLPGAPPLAGRRGDSEGRNEMDGLKIVAILLIVLGILGLAYGGFTYTKATHEVGPISIKEKETVNIPLWAGVGALVVGVVLLLTPVLRRGRS